MGGGRGREREEKERDERVIIILHLTWGKVNVTQIQRLFFNHLSQPLGPFVLVSDRFKQKHLTHSSQWNMKNM